jgi:predicted flap endonuclease-1-like 5' DNA nuclease
MMQMFEANQALLAGIVLLVVFVVWWVWGRTKPAPKKREYTDVLSEGAEKASRNNALIDAPSAAAMVTPAPVVIPSPGAGTLAGIGEVVAAAATAEISDAAPAPVVSGGDDLGRIKGVGPKLKALLTSLGVTSYAQIAAWTDADIAQIDAKLGTFAGRPVRDNWIEQAKLLAGGDTAAYEAKFGKV